MAQACGKLWGPSWGVFTGHFLASSLLNVLCIGKALFRLGTTSKFLADGERIGMAERLEHAKAQHYRRFWYVQGWESDQFKVRLLFDINEGIWGEKQMT